MGLNIGRLNAQSGGRLWKGWKPESGHENYSVAAGDSTDQLVLYIVDTYRQTVCAVMMIIPPPVCVVSTMDVFNWRKNKRKWYQYASWCIDEGKAKNHNCYSCLIKEQKKTLFDTAFVRKDPAFYPYLGEKATIMIRWMTRWYPAGTNSASGRSLTLGHTQ